jgi:hypothetical protein
MDKNLMFGLNMYRNKACSLLYFKNKLNYNIFLIFKEVGHNGIIIHVLD